MKRIVSLAAVLVAMIFASTANAWHADVAASAKCNVQTGLYDVTGSVVSSSPSGAVIKSVTPSTFPGNTTGTREVWIKVDWPNNNEEPVYKRYVTLDGKCIVVCAPTVVERIVYVDRPVEVVREVIKEVPVEKIVEKPVVVTKIKTVVKWKTKVVTKWKTRTVVKWKIKESDKCKPPPTPDCEGECEESKKNGHSG